MNANVQKVVVPLVAMVLFLVLWEGVVWAAGWPN
mgnify:CR=1 FL=1